MISGVDMRYSSPLLVSSIATLTRVISPREVPSSVSALMSDFGFVKKHTAMITTASTAAAATQNAGFL